MTQLDSLKGLVKDFVSFSANFLTLDFLEALSDERLKRVQQFSDRLLAIFNNFKSEKDFQTFRQVYEKLGINEKRIVLEIIGYTKDVRFSDFLFEIAKSSSFYSIDSIISLGQIGGVENLSRLEGLVEYSSDEVYSKVLKSVIHNLKKELPEPA